MLRSCNFPTLAHRLLLMLSSWCFYGQYACIELDGKYNPKRSAKLAAIDYMRVTHVGEPPGTSGLTFVKFATARQVRPYRAAADVRLSHIVLASSTPSSPHTGELTFEHTECDGPPIDRRPRAATTSAAGRPFFCHGPKPPAASAYVAREA
jgi:hypothetical protein